MSPHYSAQNALNLDLMIPEICYCILSEKLNLPLCIGTVLHGLVHHQNEVMHASHHSKRPCSSPRCRFSTFGPLQ